MNENIRVMLQQTKSNISRLVEGGQLDQAKYLLGQYMKMVSNDPEVLTIQGSIAVMEQRLEDAIAIFNQTLSIDPYNFDSHYNLAYIYEQKERYCEAIIAYKNAMRARQFDVEFKKLIDDKIANILQNFSKKMTNTKKIHVVLQMLNSVQNVLFIDMNLNEKTNKLAKVLSEYGINVDLAYAGDNPAAKFKVIDLSYRKILGFHDLNSIINYVEYYDYDVIQLFQQNPTVEREVEKIARKVLKFDSPVLDYSIEYILNRYMKIKENKKKKKLTYSYELANNVTIIIPTHNRPDYLKRLLRFFLNYKTVKFNIMVLDSSEQNYQQLNKEIVNTINTIRYFDFDEKIEFFDKINFGLTQVETEYVCLCADDDFITEEGLIKSLEALDKEPTWFSVKGKNLFYGNNMGNLQEYDFFHGLYDNDPIIRLRKLVNGFVPTLIYQVFRTKHFCQLYKYLADNRKLLPPNIIFREYLFYFMVLITGKVGKVNIDFNLRDKGAPGEFYVENFPHTLKNGKFNENYQLFREFLINYYNSFHLQPLLTHEIMDEIFCSFLIQFLQIPSENVMQNNGIFDVDYLEAGMRKSWVWPKGK